MGHIPKELFVAMRSPQEVILKPEEERISVLPAFVVPADSAKFVATANAWKRHYSYGSQRQVEGTSTKMSNEPVSGLRIVGLTRRRSGGRAYKVIQPPNYLVDLREDVLLDAMYNHGVSAGGRVGGEYVWSVNGSQMRLVRVGSSAYKQLSLYEDLKNLKRVPIKDLKPGSIYRGQTGPPSLFVGHISTICARSRWDYGRRDGQYQRLFLGVDTRKRKAMLWYRVYGNKCTAEDVVASFTGFITNSFNEQNNDKHYGTMEVRTSHNMRKEIGSIEMPHDIIYVLRNIARDNTMRQVMNSQRGNNRFHDDISVLCGASERINMVPYGVNPVDNMMAEFERILER